MTRSLPTPLQARNVTRRTLLKTAGFMGAAAIGAPMIVRNAFSSSGELNLFSWGDYIYPEMIEGFEKSTGIKVNLATYGTNDEVFNTIRASGGAGYDVINPSVTRTQQYIEFDLLQPIDESKVNMDKILQPILESSRSLGGEIGGKRYNLPFNWGTESICVDKTAVKGGYGELSYGTLWQPEYAGKVTCRANSIMTGIGLYLDATGKVPSGRMVDTYKDEASLRRVYDEIVKFALENKAAVGQFWTNAQETEAAFKQNGCVIGQIWDGPGMRMMTDEPERFAYVAAKEGAITWLDGIALPKQAENVEQAYAWINWYYTPENAAIHVMKSGYNSCTADADKFAGETYARNFAAAYPDNAIANLWWWPPEDTALANIRNEYRDKLLAS
ncbi:spermidine/putrescine transport system substrate-binding protein [Dongia mobilis]|uniref:Spermidine/putrescine transport system substrate-binding protein n=1 Tax=Dongia mobilis TaxID=578943 RepID=A0A4V3DF56_9PROT|nr:extracellular solute-binding protein [Dongia mobilis]TDQ83330.1 spermidine/putrescine transport system substrate-binding protein [Dongia mobilis]